MNIETKDLLPKLQKFAQKVRHYLTLIFFVGLALIYGFLLFRINSLNHREPNEDSVTEKLQTIKRPKRIDEATTKKIQQLQDNSVDVQTLFKQARDNPFQE